MVSHRDYDCCSVVRLTNFLFTQTPCLLSAPLASLLCMSEWERKGQMESPEANAKKGIVVHTIMLLEGFFLCIHV